MVIFGIATVGFSQIAISGDARVRPRMDVKDWGGYRISEEDSTLRTVDNYYLYRARLNIKADIGKGWFFNTKLGTNSAAYWTGKFGTGDIPSGSSLLSAGRGSLSFMELYFGLKKENYGFQMGLIPVSGIANPVLDLHFYPTIVVDIPWLIFNNNAAHGFNAFYKVGPGIVNATILMDNNDTQEVEYSEGEPYEAKDQTSFMLNYGMKIGGISVTPWFIKTVADEGAAAPMTYGANAVGPKIAGFTPAFSYFMTSQQVEGTQKYSGNILRTKISGKVGPGSVCLWYDMASTELDGGDTHNFSYIWAHYKYVVHKSDKGEFSIKPTVRINTEQVENAKDYSRSKFELTTEIKF